MTTSCGASDPFWSALVDGLVAWEGGERADAIWHGLLTGHWIRVDSARFCGALVILARRCQPSESRRALTTDRMDILERTALGEQGTAIAEERGRMGRAGSDSSVSQALGYGLRRLGLETRGELMFLCRARAELAPPDTLRAVRKGGQHGDFAVLVVSLSVADFRAPLSPAERDVAKLVVVGRRNADIAAARGTTGNAVANQVASILRKLRASSRYDVIVRSVSWAPATSPPDRLPAWIARRFALLVP